MRAPDLLSWAAKPMSIIYFISSAAQGVEAAFVFQVLCLDRQIIGLSKEITLLIGCVGPRVPQAGSNPSTKGGGNNTKACRCADMKSSKVQYHLDADPCERSCNTFVQEAQLGEHGCHEAVQCSQTQDSRHVGCPDNERIMCHPKHLHRPRQLLKSTSHLYTAKSVHSERHAPAHQLDCL